MGTTFDSMRKAYCDLRLKKAALQKPEYLCLGFIFVGFLFGVFFDCLLLFGFLIYFVLFFIV